MEIETGFLLLGAGFLSCGIFSIPAGSLTFGGFSEKSIRDVNARNSLPWSPAGFLGRGVKSPVFGVMWAVIYTWCVVCIVSTIVAGLGRQIAQDSQRLCFSCLLCFLAFLLASFWEVVYIQEKAWGFIASSALLLVAASALGVASFLVTPFLHTNLSWFENTCGIFFAFFFGWVLVAFAISLGTVTRYYNRGSSRLDDDESSYWPFSLGILVLILCCAFANGFIAIPMFVASFFFKGYVNRWQIWSSSILALMGLVSGVVIMLLRRSL